MQPFLTLALFGTIFLLAGGYFFWKAMQTPYKGYPEESRRVEIRRGLRTASILRHLQREGVLRDEYVPMMYMKLVRNRDSLKAGVYEFKGPLAATAVLDKVARGEVVLKTVTVREGLDRFAIAKLFSAEGLGTEKDWNRITADPELIRDIAPQAKSLEGYLFPDTYKFDPGTPASTIARAMVANFRRAFGNELAYITTGLDLHDTVTLASIVETEARLPQERPMVASVYLNRLHKQMRLGADPTVIYAMKVAGRWDGNIRKADLQIESPYNTYRVAGLPPGPIANPGVAALKAAAAPTRTSFLYFVAKQDGSHAFSNTLAEHNQNVEIYQRQWYRDRKAAAAAGQP